MKTSNFANNQRYGLNGISISRYPAIRNGFKGPEFPPLMPSAQLIRGYKEKIITWPEYTECYNTQLTGLKAAVVYQSLLDLASLTGVGEPILLCFESAKTLDKNPCHRRLVAEWFWQELKIKVPEWTKETIQGQSNLLEGVA